MGGMRSSRPRSAADPGTGSYELLGHTAEVRVRLRGPDLPALAVQAGRALAELELGRRPARAGGRWREIDVTAPDPAALLVDWLNELIFLAETERWVATEFRAAGMDGATLCLRARGVRVARAPARVKAATHHGLAVRPAPGGLEAEVILDV